MPTGEAREAPPTGWWEGGRPRTEQQEPGSDQINKGTHSVAESKDTGVRCASSHGPACALFPHFLKHIDEVRFWLTGKLVYSDTGLFWTNHWLPLSRWEHQHLGTEGQWREYLWTCQNSYVEILTLDVMVLGGVAFGRWYFFYMVVRVEPHG